MGRGLVLLYLVGSVHGLVLNCPPAEKSQTEERDACSGIA